MDTEIVNYWPGIGLALTALLFGLVSPGPSVMAIMGASMESGRRAGVALAMGVAAGTFSMGTLAALGLAALLTAYPGAMMVLKVMGGSYLLWLAYKSFRAAARQDEPVAIVQAEGSLRSYALRGYLIHMTNPKAMVAWAATIALGLTPGAPLWVPMLIVGLGTLMSVAINGAYALLFSSPPLRAGYVRARRGIQALMGGFFGAAGLSMILSRS